MRKGAATFTFEQGLSEEFSPSLQGDGVASVLENWEPRPNGGLKARRGWKSTSAASAPATRKSRGLGYFAQQSTFEAVKLRQDPGNVFTSPTLGVTCRWDKATVAGNYLWAHIYVRSSGAISPTITVPSGWTQVSTFANGNLRVYTFEIAGAASRSGTETFTFSSIASVLTQRIEMFEFSGVSSSPRDRYDTNSGSGTAITLTAGGVTTQAREGWFVAVAANLNAKPSAPTGGYTVVDDGIAGASAKEIGWTEGFKTTTSTGTPTITSTITSASWAIYSLALKARSTSNTKQYLISAERDTDTNYVLRAIPRDELDGGTWATVDATNTVLSTDKLVSFAAGLGYLAWTQPELDLVQRWDGTTSSTVASSPAGRAIAFHKSRMFVGGGGQFSTSGSEYPTRLWWSALGDITTWDNTLGFLDVGKDDGEAIEDLEVFGQDLVIGKASSLWMLSGSGPDSFQLDQLNTGGCAPGRSLCATPWGVVIAGTESVYLWTGGAGAETISRPIQDSYEVTGNYVTTCYVDGFVYICDSGSGIIYAFDLEAKMQGAGGWWLERVDSATEQPEIVYALASTMFYGPEAATTYSLAAYREHSSSARVRDYLLSQDYVLETPELWPEGAVSRITPRHLYVRVRQNAAESSALDAPLKIRPFYDDVEQDTFEIMPTSPGKAIRKRFDIGQTKGIFSVRLRLEQSPTTSHEALFDIEELSLAYDAMDKG